MDGIDISRTHLEQVTSFKYLGSIVNGNNSIEEEIKERITLANKAYYANKDLFRSKLLSKKTKLRMYHTLVRQTSGNIWLWNMGAKRKYKIKINGIRKEDLKKNLWTHKNKGRYVEDQNERRAKQTD